MKFHANPKRDTDLDVAVNEIVPTCLSPKRPVTLQKCSPELQFLLQKVCIITQNTCVKFHANPLRDTDLDVAVNGIAPKFLDLYEFL